MVNYATLIQDCDSDSPALLDLFLSSNASICSTMAFNPLGNSDHVVVSVCASFDHLCDHLRDFPWEDIFKFGASAAASDFCEWVQVGIGVYISHRKYQVKPHSSPWFLAACAAAALHRNSLLNNGKSAMPLLFNGPEVLSSASDKAKLFAEYFSKNSNLDDSGISLPVSLLEQIWTCTIFL